MTAGGLTRLAGDASILKLCYPWHMRTTGKSKQPWVLQYLCLGLMMLCACWLIKRFVWGDYGLLRYQAQISAQQKAQHQLTILLEKNKTLKAHIAQLTHTPQSDQRGHSV